LQYFCHADAAKLESTLEGVKKGHAIAMEGLNTQLQKSLAENTRLEEQLKEQECLSRQKLKEVDDLCQAAIDFENQRKGFNEVLGHFQKMLLGNFFLHTLHFLLLACFLLRCLMISAMQLHWSRTKLTPHRDYASPQML
jgi:hypothetical protein